MNDHFKQQIFRFIIALVWLVNGFFCKILYLVPRHKQIVTSILGETYSHELTLLIGVGEVAIAIWIVSGYRAKINAIIQIFLVGTMNVLEFLMVPDLLLWGRYNAVFAVLFILFIYYNEFILHPRISSNIAR